MIAAGRKSKTSADRRRDGVGVDLLGPERVDHHRHGVRGADRVRDLELAPVGEPRATTFFAT